jgi:hypothetical protein
VKLVRVVVGMLVVTCVVVSTLALILSAVSRVTSVGLFSLGPSTSIRFTRGMAEINHTYEFDIAPGMPLAQWDAYARSRRWFVPPPSLGWHSFGVRFAAGLVSASNRHSETPDLFWPERYWQLRLPLWPFAVPGIVIAALWARRWGQARHERRRGFAVEAAAILA